MGRKLRRNAINSGVACSACRLTLRTAPSKALSRERNNKQKLVHRSPGRESSFMRLLFALQPNDFVASGAK